MPEVHTHVADSWDMCARADTAQFDWSIESQMPFVFAGRASAPGTISFVLDSMQMLFGRHVGWCPGTAPLFEY